MPIGTVNAWRKAIQAGTCTSNYSQNKVFDEAGLARWTWLRSPARRVRESAAAIYSDGNLTSYPVNRSTLGLSPFFLLGEAAGYSNNTDGIKPADILKPVKTDIIERVYHTEEPEEKLFTGTEGAPPFPTARGCRTPTARGLIRPHGNSRTHGDISQIRGTTTSPHGSVSTGTERCLPAGS